ncbi:MAG: efflux RND transporter permease subunit [Proteobacteria bacterium]|nr:efflux RND transporter permease subunit [Pseudomonadota bacterium]
MSFARTVAGHQRSILFVVVLLLLGGALSFSKLPVSLFPQVDYPRLRISLSAGIRPAPQMQIEITRPVSLAIRSVPGVVNVRSTSSRGAADISVDFAWGTNMVDALLRVEGRLSQIVPSLPAGTTWQARRMDPEIDPVVAFSLTSKTLSLIRLHDIAEYQLMPLLTQISGVARVPVEGGEKAEYRVSVDPGRLLAYGLTYASVAQALSQDNVLKAVGRVQQYDKLFLVVSDTRLHSIGDIRHTVLKTGPDGVVELDDVATVGLSDVPQWQTVTADGQRAVLLPVHQLPGANTVKIAREAKQVVADFLKKSGGGITMHTWYDQSVLVSHAESSVRDAIVIGVALAALVLLAFLRSWRITFVAVAVVPAVLTITVLLLHVAGMGLNVMTLGGAAAAVGLIIDDSIVMIEHIIWRMRSGHAQGETWSERVLTAAREFQHPLVGSSSSTIIIFTPLAFQNGMTGMFFRALAITMAGSLLVSFLIAWLIVPLLSNWLLGARDINRRDTGPVMERVNGWYERALSTGMRRPWLALLVALPLAGIGYVAFGAVGSGFLPPIDQGGFVLDYRMPAGTSLQETDRVLRQIGTILRSTPAVQTYSRRTGLQMGGGLTEPYTGDFFVRLKSRGRPPIWTVMDQVKNRVEHSVPGIDVGTSQLMEDLIGDLTAVPQPIEVKLFAESPDQLLPLAPKVAAAIAKVPGLINVRDGIVPAGDSIEVKVDRASAALKGMTPAEVTAQLAEFVSGTVATQVEQSIKMIGVRVWVPSQNRSTLDDLKSLWLRAPDGHMVPLGSVATVSILTGQPEITQENLRPMVGVTARLAPGLSLGKEAAAVKQVLEQGNLLPPGVSYEMGGIYAQQQIAIYDLTVVFLAALLLVFALVLFLYESFLICSLILTIQLLAVLAVFIGLWITGTQRNITAMMGLTMIVGIVTEIAIFFFSEFYTVEAEGRAAKLRAAGVNRLRPIAMTTIAAILALTPLALGIGQGAALLRPLAIAIISGLIAQMPLVLWFMPVAFHGLNQAPAAVKRRLRRG